MQQRPALEQLAQAQADSQHQQHETQADPEHVWHAAAQAEIHAAGQQHHIVRPRGDRGDKGKQDKGQQQFWGHDRLRDSRQA